MIAEKISALRSLSPDQRILLAADLWREGVGNLRIQARLIFCLALWFFRAMAAGVEVEQWGTFELALPGAATGNPFLDARFSARFSHGGNSFKADGFYDGEGIYRVRFMPGKTGEWHYATSSNLPELEGKTGTFTVRKASKSNHGPVRVARTFHFAYADGVPFKQIGTTCYAWIHQPEELQRQTLQTLATAPFNKVRFCVFPKRYSWNTNEPSLYPFEGNPPNQWNKERFNPKYFQHLEQRILDLQKLGIEADIILFHPYDKGHWGFDRMSPAEDDRYLRYLVSRLAAFRNVWWSLANEYDFMKEKSEADWVRIGELVHASDPYGHLLSIHNGTTLFNHTLPWITHASIQNGSAVEDAGRAVLLRDAYRKPIVYDEVKYEGNIPRRWGNLTPEEMVYRFWQGTVAGTYVGHGETYLDPADILWWSKGGVLHGQSPPRLKFLRQVLEDGPAQGIDPLDKWQEPEYGGQPGQYYLIYLGKQAPASWKFRIPVPDASKLKAPLQFKAEVLDTWNMTITPVDGIFTVGKTSEYLAADRDGRSIALPGRPYMAIRAIRSEK